MQVLEALNRGQPPAALPEESIRRLLRQKLLASGFSGRILVTGVGRELLLRRHHKLLGVPADTAK